MRARTSAVRPASIRSGALNLLAAAIGIAAALTLTGATQRTEVITPRFDADFWYDVSDPTLIAGEASFVVVGEVERSVRRDGDRTIYRVRVLDRLRGQTPPVIGVSQLGFVEGDARYELDGFPLMEAGRRYVMALAAPARSESQDALVLLSASGAGNRVEVDDPDDERVTRYRHAVEAAQSPFPAGSDGHATVEENLRRWLRGNRGYASSGPPAPRA
jgi:hypothetical protein